MNFDMDNIIRLVIMIPSSALFTGIDMWIGYSLIFWPAAFAGLWNMTVAGVLIVIGCIARTG